MKFESAFIIASMLVSLASAPGEDRLIQPGDSPQAVLDGAAPGDRLVLMPGLHQHGLGKHRALLYVDKSIDIELREGATLKLADDETKLEAAPEITTDQDAAKKLDDLVVGGSFDLSRPSIFTIKIDSEGSGENADSFAWGVFHHIDNPEGDATPSVAESKFGETPNQRIPVTGDWQPLAHGVEIRFGGITGHSKGSTWFITYDGPAAYGIRIGHGRQKDYIENVRMHRQRHD